MPLLIDQRIVTEGPWQILDQAALDEDHQYPKMAILLTPHLVSATRNALQQRTARWRDQLKSLMNDLGALLRRHSPTRPDCHRVPDVSRMAADSASPAS